MMFSRALQWRDRPAVWAKSGDTWRKTTWIELGQAAAGLAALMRRSSAAARHLVWTVALLAALVLPLITVVAPRWELPLLPSVARVASAPVESSAAATPGDASALADRLAQRAQAEGAEPRTEPRTPEPNPAPGTSAPRTWFFWFLGFALVLSRLALGSARMWWIARTRLPCA